jgi:hypothetical protein
MLPKLSRNDTNEISCYMLHRAFPLSRISRAERYSRAREQRIYPDLIGFHFIFESGRKEQRRRRLRGGQCRHANHSRGPSRINIRQFAFPRAAATVECRTDHFQDGCRHFARYTPKVLLPTKFQLASSVAAGLYVYAYSYARRAKIRGIRHLLLHLPKTPPPSLPLSLSLSVFFNYLVYIQAR